MARVNDWLVRFITCKLHGVENLLFSRKHFLRVSIEIYENSKKLWKHSPVARVPTAFLVLPNFHSCFYNSIETRKMFSISLENSPRKITKNEENLIVLFIIKT